MATFLDRPEFVAWPTDDGQGDGGGVDGAGGLGGMSGVSGEGGAGGVGGVAGRGEGGDGGGVDDSALGDIDTEFRRGQIASAMVVTSGVEATTRCGVTTSQASNENTECPRAPFPLNTHVRPFH